MTIHIQDRQTNRQMDRQTEKERQMDRQTEKERQTDRKSNTHPLIDAVHGHGSCVRILLPISTELAAVIRGNTLSHTL